ncbi:MAG: phosphoribosyl-AMP cyclohydrolase [Pseudomonadota bacterium]
MAASNEFFLALESEATGSSRPLQRVLDQIPFNEQGLIPAIAQDDVNGDVLMLAWMNRAALEKTIRTGVMTYWSRSREAFWVKGESSGHFQRVQSMALDCDGDTLLCKVIQEGAACHTGRRDCFYLNIDRESDTVSVTCDKP